MVGIFFRTNYKIWDKITNNIAWNNCHNKFKKYSQHKISNTRNLFESTFSLIWIRIKSSTSKKRTYYLLFSWFQLFCWIKNTSLHAWGLTIVLTHVQATCTVLKYELDLTILRSFWTQLLISFVLQNWSSFYFFF